MSAETQNPTTNAKQSTDAIPKAAVEFMDKVAAVASTKTEVVVPATTEKPASKAPTVASAATVVATGVAKAPLVKEAPAKPVEQPATTIAPSPTQPLKESFASKIANDKTAATTKVDPKTTPNGQATNVSVDKKADAKVPLPAHSTLPVEKQVAPAVSPIPVVEKKKEAASVKVDTSATSNGPTEAAAVKPATEKPTAPIAVVPPTLQEPPKALLVTPTPSLVEPSAPSDELKDAPAEETALPNDVKVSAGSPVPSPLLPAPVVTPAPVIDDREKYNKNGKYIYTYEELIKFQQAAHSLKRPIDLPDIRDFSFKTVSIALFIFDASY